MDATLDIELWDAFNDIFFNEGTHKYTDSVGTHYTSVTTWVHNFAAPTDWDAMCEKKAAKLGISKEELRKQWDYNRDYSCDLGTEVHAVMENAWRRKRYDIKQGLEISYPEITEDFITRKHMCSSMMKALKEVYVPVRNEFIVYDRESGICGTIDFLCYNRKLKCFSILDWKTNKEIRRDNKWQSMCAPFQDLDDCNFNHYSLQLSTYKYILEKNTNMRIGELAICWIPPGGKIWESYPCIDLSSRVAQLCQGGANGSK